MHSKYPLETKLNVYCERLDLSLTDTQLPMLIRLIELCLALYYGTMEFKIESNTDEPDQQSVDRESKTGENNINQIYFCNTLSYIVYIYIIELDYLFT
jgi:vacuolar protein sorting-associated protein 13B